MQNISSNQNQNKYDSLQKQIVFLCNHILHSIQDELGKLDALQEGPKKLLLQKIKEYLQTGDFRSKFDGYEFPEVNEDISSISSFIKGLTAHKMAEIHKEQATLHADATFEAFSALSALSEQINAINTDVDKTIVDQLNSIIASFSSTDFHPRKRLEDRSTSYGLDLIGPEHRDDFIKSIADRLNTLAIVQGSEDIQEQIRQLVALSALPSTTPDLIKEKVTNIFDGISKTITAQANDKIDTIKGGAAQTIITGVKDLFKKSMSNRELKRQFETGKEEHITAITALIDELHACENPKEISGIKSRLQNAIKETRIFPNEYKIKIKEAMADAINSKEGFDVTDVTGKTPHEAMISWSADLERLQQIRIQDFFANKAREIKGKHEELVDNIKNASTEDEVNTHIRSFKEYLNSVPLFDDLDVARSILFKITFVNNPLLHRATEITVETKEELVKHVTALQSYMIHQIEVANGINIAIQAQVNSLPSAGETQAVNDIPHAISDLLRKMDTDLSRKHFGSLRYDISHPGPRRNFF